MEEKMQPEKKVLRPEAPQSRNDPWRINHPVLDIAVGDTIEFDPCGHEAEVWVPVAEIFGTHSIELHEKPDSFKVVGGEAGEVYPYSFYLSDLKVMLEGDSPPRFRLRR